ncbi:hypothetical protein ABTY98_00130 [Streptomyces sp. NPDC096040]|uniref:hypothetical protein n=1 Tax=Streptomyces sp. NPDC096040 TaxID=3155541 RepID=UPI00331AD88B
MTVSTAVSAATGNRIAFNDLRVAQGEIPAPVQDLLENAFDKPLPVKNVPEGLRLRTINATDRGISARLTGHTVTFRPGSSAA